MNAVSVGMLYTGDKIAMFGLFGRVVHLITLLPTFSAIVDGNDCNMNIIAIRLKIETLCDDNGIDFLICNCRMISYDWNDVDKMR